MTALRNIEHAQLEDHELLRMYRQGGDADLLAHLFLRYYDMLYATCVKYLDDQEAARDAVMAVYETLPAKVKQHEIEQFRGWLYVVTRNHCLMELRQKKKLPTTSLDGQLMQSGEFLHLEEVMEKERQLDQLTRCLEKLSDQQQQTVRLFYLENRCYNEICDLTGLEWNKVRSLIQNGRRNLKICMDNA